MWCEEYIIIRLDISFEVLCIHFCRSCVFSLCAGYRFHGVLNTIFALCWPLFSFRVDQCVVCWPLFSFRVDKCVVCWPLFSLC